MTAALVAALLLFPAVVADDPRQIDSVNLGATATAPAVRLTVPVVAVGEPPLPGLHGLPFAPAGDSDHDRVAYYVAQWALPAGFMWLAYRESRYRNDVRTWCCYGVWQLFINQFLRDHRAGPRLRNECSVFGIADVYGLAPLQEQKQACAAAVVYSISGFGPWR